MRISDWSSDVCSSDLPPPADNYLPYPALQISNHPQAEGQEQQGRPDLKGAHRHLPRQRAAEQHGRHIGDHHAQRRACRDREDIRSEEHTSELQSLMSTSYAVSCLKKTQLAYLK